MVVLRPLFLFLLFCSAVYAQDVKVAVDINQGPIGVNQPVRGTISITHESNATIDNASFKLGKDPLSVEFVREVKLVGNNVLSIYRFESKGMPKGLYVLPAISANVGGTAYKSPMTSYEVQGNGGTQYTPSPSSQSVYGTATAPQPVANTNQAASIKLEAFVDGESKIYPGQRTRLTYKATYTGHIDLREEVLPLLKPDGLRKIGDIDTKEEQSGELSVLLISQLVEGLQPGTFTYGPSYVEGLAYQETPGGRKVYVNPPIHSKAPPVTVEVLPFPAEIKPASFKGAIGPLAMDVKLTSPSTVNVGDKITLTVDLTGNTLLENVLPPDVCCQPGFSGMFKASDLPPQSVIKGKTKTFIFDLWPLSTEIKEIPPIEYAYFNPDTSKYEILKSEPIPLKVLSGKKTEEVPAESPVKPIEEEKPAEPIPTRPIEIQTIYPLNCSDLHNLWFGTWNIFGLIPIGAALLLMQTALRDALIRRRMQVKRKTSSDYFEEAEKNLNNSTVFFPLINTTLILWLKENGEITDETVSPEELPQTGNANKVRQFLMGIQEKRFTGKNDLPLKDILQKAQDIMENKGETS